MRYYQKIQWLAVVFMLLVGLVGCDSGDGGLTAPANVPTGSASPANFWVGRGGDKLQVYQEPGELQITVPEGAFMLTYVTHLGTFQIVFYSEEGAFFAIGLLEGDEFVDVFLQEGEIPDTAVPDPEYSNEGVDVYCAPASSTPVPWYETFVFTPTTVLIMIMDDGVFVTDNPFMVIIVLLVPIVENTGEGARFTIFTSVNDDTLGYITPEGPLQRPGCSSQSFHIHHNTRDFDPLQDIVMANGIDITPWVQILGSGDGHLVIYDIREDILLKVIFAP